jgi:hypothetical protein
MAVLAAAGAIAYARAEVRTARDEAQANESRAIALQKDAEKIKTADQVRRDASEKALRVYDLLGSEKEGPALNQAMTQAMHLDRGQLSSLESKAIDDRAAGMKQKIAEAARSAGESAFRHQDWKGASQELGRYVELEPKPSDNMIWFHLGRRGSSRARSSRWRISSRAPAAPRRRSTRASCSGRHTRRPATRTARARSTSAPSPSTRGATSRR